jgi:tetratricopeptide (TPR) repeat protein
MKKNFKITLFFTLLIAAGNILAQDNERDKGIEFYNKGEFQQAAEILQKAVETDEQDRKSWLYLGMSYASLKNKKQAVNAFKKAEKVVLKEPKESDEKETPVKIISKPRAQYTDSARQNQVQGTIKLAVEFGADGTIKAVFAFQTLPDGLTENCIEAAKQTKFEPATKDGKAVASVAILVYSFTIY